MIIISGKNNQKLAHAIAKKLSSKLIFANTEKFQNGELYVKLKGDFKDQVVIIIQSTSHPANDHVMELMLIANMVRNMDAAGIIAIMPYFGYSRQDFSPYEGGISSASLLVELIKTSGIEKIITLDLHSLQTEIGSKGIVCNLDSLSLTTKLFKEIKNVIVVSPDKGGLERAKKLATVLKCEVAVIDKIRASSGKCIMNNISNNVNGKECIIIDDIIDTGETLFEACNFLKQQGAHSINAFITHGIFSSLCVKKLRNAPLKKLYISDSIIHVKLPEKIEIVSCVDIFVEALKSLINANNRKS